MAARRSTRSGRSVDFLPLAFENNTCVDLAMRRGGSPKIPVLQLELARRRAAIAPVVVELAAVHAALAAVRRGDRGAAAATARAAPIAPDKDGRVFDYAEPKRSTDDFIEMCR